MSYNNILDKIYKVSEERCEYFKFLINSLLIFQNHVKNNFFVLNKIILIFLYNLIVRNLT